MVSVTFTVSPEVERGKPLAVVDHASLIAKAYQRPIEAMWKPNRPITGFGEDHALLRAIHDSFFLHYPLVLSPDAIWLTLARGFATHVSPADCNAASTFA